MLRLPDLAALEALRARSTVRVHRDPIMGDPKRKVRGPRKPKAASKGEETLCLHIRADKLPEPQREFRFALPRQWRFDLAWPDRLVAVEIEGGIGEKMAKSRHTKIDGFEADAEKYLEAALRGWVVVRVTTRMVMDGRALAFTKRALAVRPGASPAT